MRTLDWVDGAVDCGLRTCLPSRTDSGWTNSRLDITLSAGRMYNHDAGGVLLQSPELAGVIRNLDWDAAATVPRGHRGAAILAGTIIMDPTTLGCSWGTTDRDGPGTWKIAQTALSSVAEGRISGISFDLETAGRGRRFEGSINDGHVGPLEQRPPPPPVSHPLLDLLTAGLSFREALQRLRDTAPAFNWDAFSPGPTAEDDQVLAAAPFAGRGQEVPEPASAALVLPEILLVARRRRRA